MSQEVVYRLLKELGGPSTTAAVAELARRRYPHLSLHSYVGLRLKALEKWGYVERGPGGTWRVVREYL